MMNQLKKITILCVLAVNFKMYSCLDNGTDLFDHDVIEQLMQSEVSANSSSVVDTVNHKKSDRVKNYVMCEITKVTPQGQITVMIPQASKKKRVESQASQAGWKVYDEMILSSFNYAEAIDSPANKLVIDQAMVARCKADKKFRNALPEARAEQKMAKNTSWSSKNQSS